jgi:hypothetical protein
MSSNVRLLGTLVLTTWALGGTGHAELIDSGATTLDTETGLEWLDVTETLGVSAFDIIVNGYGNLVADGWGHATVEQIDTLFQHAGIPGPYDGTLWPPGFSGADRLIRLLGASGTSADGFFIQAFSGTLVAPGPPFLRYTPVVMTALGSIGGATLPGVSVPSSVNNATIGNYLVRLAQVGPIQVTIDIRPGSARNPVNPRSRGILTVAVLTTDEFDATEDIDPLTIRFGPAEATPVGGSTCFEDVDEDGDFDLLLRFRTQDTGIQCGETSVLLRAEDHEGAPLEGSDSIVTVGCGPPLR